MRSKDIKPLQIRCNKPTQNVLHLFSTASPGYVQARGNIMRLSITFKAVKHSFPQLVIKFSNLLDNKLASRWQGHKPEILLPSHFQTPLKPVLSSV